MSRSLTHGAGENGVGIPGACATRNFTYLARGPLGDKTVLPLLEQTLITFDIIHNVHASDVKAPGIFKHSRSRLDMIAPIINIRTGISQSKIAVSHWDLTKYYYTSHVCDSCQTYNCYNRYDVEDVGMYWSYFQENFS